jgi:murein DD-endopeptidase MepM/ murein hydrolase activator NlpD
MANEFYTLIVVPHAKARFRQIRVPVRLAKWTFTAVGVVGFTVAGVLVHYARITAEIHDLRRLRTENSELLTKTRTYEENAGKLQAKVLQLQTMVTKLGVMAGLEHSLPEAGSAGVGGAVGMESQAPVLAPRALAAIDESLTSLTRRSAQLEEFYRDQTLVLASTPSIWPVRGYLSAGFGNRKDPFTGQRDFHSGIDISTPIGTRIFAPADGVILSAAVQGAYGNSIMVDHGYGVVTRYGHLDAYAVRAGQRVRRGDLIGFVGSTGRSTGPHLHYEVWVRDQAQNPIHFILDEYRTFG